MPTKKNIKYKTLKKPDGNINKKPNKYNHFIILLLILILTIIGYSSSIKNDFIFWDDDKQITDNPYIKDFSFSNLSYNFTHESFTFLPLLTYAINYKIWGLNPYPFHIINLFLHLLNVFLVFYFIRLISKKYETALITCILFAIHPMRIESVAWISERKDLLFTLFFICSLIFYYFYINSKYKKRFLVFSFICGYLSSLSKIQAFSLPIVLFILDYYYSRKFNFKTIVEKIVLFFIMFSFIISPFFSYIIQLSKNFADIYLNIFYKTLSFIINFGNVIKNQVVGYYFYGNNREDNAPLFILFALLIFAFIFLRNNSKLTKILNVFFNLRYIIFPIFIYLILNFISDEQIQLLITFIFTFLYFINFKNYKSSYDIPGLIASFLTFCGALIIFIYLKTFENKLFLISFAILTFLPLLNFIKVKYFNIGYYFNFLFAIYTITFLPQFSLQLSIVIIIWLIINNFNFANKYYLSFVFISIILFITPQFSENTLFFLPYILWYAIDYFYKNNKVFLFDFLFNRLILFFILSTLIFEQLISPIYEYTGIILLYLIYIFTRKYVNNYFEKKLRFKYNFLYKTKHFILNKFAFTYNYLLNTTINTYRYFINNKKLTYVFFSILIVLIFSLMKNYISFWSQTSISEYSFNFIDRIFLACYSLTFYILNYFYPFNLSAIHTYPKKIGAFLPYNYYFSAIAVILVLFIVIYLLKKYKKFKKELLLGILFFLVNISLVLHIIPIQGRLVVADRYSYLAYLGLFYINGQIYTWIKYNNIHVSRNIKKYIYIFFIIYISMFFIYTYNRNKVWKDSITLFDDVIKKDSTISFAYTNRGWTKFIMKDFQGSLRDYNKAIELDTNLAGAYNNRGWLKYNIGDINGAISDYNIAIKKQPNFDLALNNRGKAKLELKDNKSALNDFNKAISNNPNNAIAWCNRAKIKMDNKDYKGAMIDLNKSIKLDPDFALAYYNRGLAKYNTNDVTGAISDYTKAINLDKTYALAYHNRAFAFYSINRLSESLSDYNLAIQYKPDLAIAYNNRGWVKFNMNDIKGAIEDYGKAIELQPNFLDPYNNRGWAKIQNQIQDYKGAIEDFNIVLSYNPKISSTYYNRGLAKSYLLDYNGAIEDYNKAIEITPDYFSAINDRGWAYFKLGKTNDAISNYKKAIAINNKSVIPLKNLAWTYYSIKNYQEAINYYSLVLKLSNINPEAYHYRGLSYLNLKNTKAACNDWQKAKELGYKESNELINKYCK